MIQQRIAYSYINKLMNEAIIFTGNKLSWRSNVNGRVWFSSLYIRARLE